VSSSIPHSNKNEGYDIHKVPVMKQGRYKRTELILMKVNGDRLCGLVVRVPGYRSRGPGSIPGDTRFSEKQLVWNGVHLST
jgi:hypothetical protein